MSAKPAKETSVAETRAIGTVVWSILAIGLYSTRGIAAAFLLTFGTLLVYAFLCWRWPFAACLMCDGGRKFQSKRRLAWNRCKWCKGTGQRRRVGRMIFAKIHKAKKRAG